MKETLARLTVLFTILLVPGLILGYQYLYLPYLNDRGIKVFHLTAVAGSGTFTLDRVDGLNYWWKRFPSATIVLETGDRAVIRVQSADVSHRFYVPVLDLGPVDIRPGHPVEIPFTAVNPGRYQYFCDTICGPCHFWMSGWIVVTPPGGAPETPPPLNCPICPGDAEPPSSGDIRELGEWLFMNKGCVTCHGVGGRGGIVNYNYAKPSIPPHNRTAEKLFLGTPEEADAFTALLAHHENLRELPETPEEIPLYPVVFDRYLALKEIIRNGSRPEKLDPAGPEPPHWMPAWKYLLTGREIDGLIIYFIGLEPWEEEPDAEP